MSNKIMSIFGDEFFPKWGKGMSSTKREKAVNYVIDFLKKTRPDLVYVMPTKGTASIIPLICMAAKIPFILVSPFPGFYNGVTKLDKVCIQHAMDKAKSFIVIYDGEPTDISHADEIWKETVQFMSNVSDAIVFMYSENTGDEYKIFMDNICQDYEETNKHVWEVVYDSDM